MSKKITSMILVLCMMLSCVAVGSFAVQAATADSAATGSGSQEAQDTVQGSAVLHCFDWSYNSIRQNLQAIKNAGYTAVQTSPVQPPKDYNSSYTDQAGQWWKLYQPIDIAIGDGNTWLGTKADLKNLCTEAENYGIKVIVDIVANHMADNARHCNGLDNVSSQVSSTLRQSQYWHTDDFGASDGDRYKVTHGHIDLPDLNTGNSYIQQRYKDLLVELVNLGVDGFRFDAAKHIELPSDPYGSSNFWPTIINGAKAANANTYFYGEILNGADTSMKNYATYMSYTDNYAGDKALVSANNNNAAGLADSNYYKQDSDPYKSVIWVESHDTYMGSSGSAGLGNTSGVSTSTITKAWAIVGSRANSTALFFARPATSMGAASTDTTWKSTAVAEVNKFKNYFDGESEYLSSSGNVAYNERGTSGVVISKLDGSGSVSLTAHKMASGTYKDQVSGNTFTVSGGRIMGNVGSTGVAVVYNATAPGPSVTVNPGSTSYKTDTLSVTLTLSNATSGQYSVDGGAYTSFTGSKTVTIGSGKDYGTTSTLAVKASNDSTTSAVTTYTYTKVDPASTPTIYFDNSSYNWSNVYAYIYNDDGQYAAWPGTAMTKDSTTGYYTLDVPEGFESCNVIFTESTNATTNRYPADQQPGLALDNTSMIFAANNSWSVYTAPTQPKTQPTTQPTTQPKTQPTTQPTTQPVSTPVGKVLIGDVNLNGKITISDATYIQMHCAEMIELEGDAAIAADVNKDGFINVKDVTVLQRYLAELVDSSSHCGEYADGTQPETDPTTKPTTEPTTEPVDDTDYIYYQNTDNWSTVYAYFWDSNNQTVGNAWPGTKMDYRNGGAWRIEVPSGAANVIFNNGGNGSQTGDLSLSGNIGKIYNNGSWQSYGGTDTTTPTIDPKDDGDTYTIYFTNNAGWSGTIYCYYWGGSSSPNWPGVAMTNVSGLVYKAQVPKDATNMLFNANGSGASQTASTTVQGSASYQTNGQQGNGWYNIEKIG